MNTSRQDKTFILLILAILVIFFHETIFTGKVFYHYDNILLNIPIKSFLVDGIKNGKLTLWHSGIYSGIPIFAEGQNDVFFMPFLIFYILLPIMQAYKFAIILSFFLTGLFQYFFLKSIKLDSMSSFLGSMLFAFGGYSICQLSHASIQRSFMLFPLLFLLILKIFENGINLRISLLALISLILSTGLHQQMFVYLLISLSAFIFFIFIQAKVDKSLDFKQLSSRMIISLSILILLITVSAVQYLPSAELGYYSNRGESPDYGFFTSCSFPPQNLLTFFLPGYFGKPSTDTYWGLGEHGWYGELCIYIGIIPLFLAIFALLFCNHPLKHLFGCLSLLSIVIALGKFTPLSTLLFRIPLLNMMRTPSRILVLTLFTFSILSSIGFERFTQNKNKLFKQKTVCIVLFLLIIISISMWIVLPYLNLLLDSQSKLKDKFALDNYWISKIDTLLHEDILSGIIYMNVFFICFVILFFLTRVKSIPLSSLTILLVFVDLYMFSLHQNPSAYPDDILKTPGYMDLLGREKEPFRIFRYRVKENWSYSGGHNINEKSDHLSHNASTSIDPWTPGWIYHDTSDGIISSLPPNTHTLFNLHSCDGYLPLSLKDYNDGFGISSLGAMIRYPYSENYINHLNVKYVISSTDLSFAGLSKIRESNGINLYYNGNYLPRTLPVPSSINPMNVKRNDFSYSISEDGYNKFTFPGNASKIFRLKHQSYDHDHIILDCIYENEWNLFFSEIMYPGWIAKVDSKPAEFSNQGNPFRIIKLKNDIQANKTTSADKEGRVIELVYLPFSFKIGLYISLTTLLILISIITLYISKKPEDKTSSSEIDNGQSIVNLPQTSNQKIEFKPRISIIYRTIYILLCLFIISGFLFNIGMWVDNISQLNLQTYLVNLQVKNAALFYNNGKIDKALRIINTLYKNFPEKKELEIIRSRIAESQ